MRTCGELVVSGAYNYSGLDPSVAEQVQSSAARIRGKVKKTLEDVIDVGRDLLAVKEALPHGQFGPWVRAEFGWAERTVRNFMAVAELFGAKAAIIADLAIQPTAAYLLAAPSVPDKARITAIERAEAGQTVTIKVARELVAKERKQEHDTRSGDIEEFYQRLRKSVERCQKWWKPLQRAKLARSLRELANELDAPQTQTEKAQARKDKTKRR